MKGFGRAIPVILLGLFELIVGFMLFGDPVGFTRTVITVFGVLLLVLGAVYLVLYLRDVRHGEGGILTVISAVVMLLLGIAGTFFPDRIIGLFTVLAVVYGVILIIAGVYKLVLFFRARQLGFPGIFFLVSGLAALICGIVIFLNPFATTVAIWRFAGVVLIVEAVLDIIAAIHSSRKIRPAD